MQSSNATVLARIVETTTAARGSEGLSPSAGQIKTVAKSLQSNDQSRRVLLQDGGLRYWHIRRLRAVYGSLKQQAGFHRARAPLSASVKNCTRT